MLKFAGNCSCHLQHDPRNEIVIVCKVANLLLVSAIDVEAFSFNTLISPNLETAALALVLG